MQSVQLVTSHCIMSCQSILYIVETLQPCEDNLSRLFYSHGTDFA